MCARKPLVSLREVAVVCISVALLSSSVHAITALEEVHKWAAEMDFFGSASSTGSSTKCFNGGVPVGDRCTCPIYYTSDNCSQRQCPNSVGGKGAYRVLPVNDQTKYCDHCDPHSFSGLNCQLCQSNAACKQYAGSNAVCDSSLSIRGDNKQFQCTLKNDFFIRVMGGKRRISAEILLNCTTPDGSSFSKTNSGVCSMAIYRMEPNASYIDPFFRCDASQCSQRFGEAQSSTDNNNTLRQRFFRAAKTLGQVALVVECALLASLGCITHILGPQRTKSVTIGMASLITLTVITYVALMILSMQSPSGPVRTIIYDCKKTKCTCAEDPPSIYDPICSESKAVNDALNTVQNSIRLICGANGSQCTLTLTDLELIFQADCRASECVDPKRFPDAPSSDNESNNTNAGVSVLARQNLGILLCFLVLIVGAAVGIHYHYTCTISHKRGKEFLVIFHVNTPFDEESSDGNNINFGRAMGRTVVDDNSVSLLGSAVATAAADSPLDGNGDVEASAPLMGDAAAPTTWAEQLSLLPRRAPSATRGSRRADSTVSVRASVYEQASALTPEECAQIDHLRRLTAAALELRVSELRYTLDTPVFGAADERARRDILHRINFTVHSGDVLAIMGPSGAGKTTLLDLLAARAKSGVVGGSITLNGTEVNTTDAHAAQYRNIIGYVSQEDTLLPSLTVEQTIFYAAQLKLPTAFSRNTVRRIVCRIIEALKLQHCAQTLIGGDTTRGISGGEKRRVSIAVELLANPRILYLDEPTSGLDTVSAKRVIEAVVELAKDSPMRVYAPHYFAFRPIVIFSIHQPSQEIYELFDKVLLLSRGMSIYCGPAAAAAATMEQRVTAAFGRTRDVPRKELHNNQAEYVMKVEEMLDDAVRAELQEDALDNTSGANILDQEHLYNTNNDSCNNNSGAGGTSPNPATTVPPCRTPGSPPPRTPTQSSGRTDVYTSDTVTGEDILSTTFGFRMYYANTYQQLHLLISRSLTCLVGSFHLVMCHSAVVVCLATLMCVLYQHQALDLPGSLNRAGSVSFLLLVTSFVSLSCLEQLILERKLFNVERENGFYTTWPYLISKIAVDIVPLRIIPAMVLASVIYFPMGFRVDAGIHFFYFVLITVLFSVCITMMILCIGIVSGSFGAAALLSSVFILWNFVFGGALVQAETIPSSLRAFKSLSPFFLAFEPLMVNELDEQQCVFSPTDETGKKSSASIDIMCRQYLANLGLKPERFNADVMQLAVYCLFFVGLAWVLLSTCSKLVR